MVAVNWRRIPTVLQPDELMDKAFSAATKKANLVDDPDKYHRVRKQMLAMIQSSCDILETTLRKWISKWPSLDRLSSFDAALVDAAVGRDEFKQNLGGIQWAADKINELNREGQSRMAKHRSIEEFHDRRKHIYGRCASILRQIGPQLAWLNDARNIMREFPTIDTMDPCIVVAGSPDGIVMIEAGANQLSEQDTIEAIDFGYEAVTELIKSQEDLLKDLKIKQIKPSEPEEDKTLPSYLEKNCAKAIELVLKKFDQSKEERDLELETIKNETQSKIESLKDDNQIKVLISENDKLLNSDFKKLTKTLMRSQIINDGKRVDGRELDEVRKISASAGILPKRVHGSALFQRGLTQVLSTTTLGTPSDAQEMDDLNPSTEKTYLHHYNFPPYSVGETRPMRTPGRREIGHGALAERAIIPVLPGKETFPYVLRVVSEVLSSNGSTSMGSVCGSTLSLLDAGVPLKAPVSGTAMGLIKEGKEIRILTDIQGIEDFLGDMDFKVAGTEKGITALQMDMKITGLPVSVISDAIKKARPARIHILEKMQEAIDKPQESLSPHAPRLLSFRIDPELIGTVIGPGGRTIKGITERTNTKIDIEDGGIVTIASHDGAAAEEAQKIIEGLTRKVHEGEIFSGVVTRIIPIGAFVEILPGKEGMVHISQLSEARVERVEDVVRQGDEVTVRVREIDSRGRINLTLRGVAQNGGMSYPEPTPTPVAPLN